MTRDRGDREEPLPGVSITPAHPDQHDGEHGGEHGGEHDREQDQRRGDQRDGRDEPGAREETMKISDSRGRRRQVYIDDVSGCPVGTVCLTCGTDTDLTVATVNLDGFGVGCVTVCRADLDAGRLPRLSAAGAAHLMLGHCAHLGITVEQMDTLAGGGGR